MFVIPAIDLRNGMVVRLHQGRFERETRYALDPIVVALQWRQQGAAWIHVIDLDGAASGRPQHVEILKRMAASIDCPIQIGGGLRSLADIDAVLEAGAQRAILGSAALSSPSLVHEAAKRHGERIAVAIDVRRGKVCVSGWQRDVETSPVELAMRLRDAGVVRIIYTDVTRDGTMRGANAEATQRIALATGLAVIASGGVSSIEELRELARLRDVGVEAAIVGKALYARRFTLREAIEATRGG